MGSDNSNTFLIIAGIIFLFMYFLSANILGASQKDTGGTTQGSGDCPAMTQTLGKLEMPYPAGKIGFEDHMTDINNPTRCFVSGSSHYLGKDSHPADAGHFTLNNPDNSCGSYNPRTTDQEHWYFNMRWKSADVAHKKVVIRNPRNGKCLVASIEEWGPAARLMVSDGINAGASNEVTNYLETGDPYTKTPNDKKGGYAEFGFAVDQNVPLGPAGNSTSTQNNTPNNGTSTVAKADVAKHNSVSDCWIILSNIAYDISKFSHSGPQSHISCGKDNTNEIKNQHGLGYESYFSKMKVGDVKN